MVHELFFEIVREKQHVFCDAKDSAPVLELKRIIEGVLKIPVTDQVLVRLLDDTTTNFQPLDDKKTLAESGFNVNNAKAQTPAMVALMMRGESTPIISELSTPPPVPDAMRNEPHSQDSSADFLKLPKRQRIQRQYDLGTLGPVTEFVGTAEEVCQCHLFLVRARHLLHDTGWSEGLLQNMEDETDARERADFLSVMSRYIDLYAHPAPKHYAYRTVYLAHAVNHVIRTRNLVISNSRKLSSTAAKGEATEDLIEASRDQGFVRPTVLILCPFKKDAYDIVERLERLIFGKNKVSTWSRDRFHTEFKSEPAPTFKTRICEEYKELITGNNDDCFRVGIAISKKVLKLFEAFDKSDIILCSLWLRMILDGDAGRESHLISNIQIAVVDKIEIPLCQELRRFKVTDPSEQALSRFNCFKEYCAASLLPGTCVVIPSYFDFVRVRNHFKRSEESFVACHEYAPKTKILRARDLFYHKHKKVLLVTERYYFFNRKALK
ncbi:hypothetical protein OSTOST_23667, partial [Ostertagia ostertagi]